MGIRFLCIYCDQKIHVKAFLAGKRGRCPHCDEKIRIPDESMPDGASPIKSKKEETEFSPAVPTSAVEQPIPANSADHSKELSSEVVQSDSEHLEESQESESGTFTATPEKGGAKVDDAIVDDAKADKTDEKEPRNVLTQTPDAQWYVSPPSGGQFGPASGEMMQAWIKEGRISADSLIWREGLEEWELASKILGSLLPQGQPSIPAPTVSPEAAEPKVSVTQNQDIGPDYSTRSRSRYSQSRMRSRTIGVIVVIVLGFISVFLLLGIVYAFTQLG